MLHLFLGGAALQRCDQCIMNPALALRDQPSPLGVHNMVGRASNVTRVFHRSSVRASARYGVNHPLAVIHSSTRRNTMRKLSNLFMALSLLCFAVPVFA